MMDETAAKQLVADAGRMLLAEGLAARTWGNVSCRTGREAMAITPSGLGYEHMALDDIVLMDMVTGDWKGTRKPSSEKAVHLAAYHAFPDAGFVIHTHQTYASAFGLAGFDSLDLSVDEKATLGGVALAGYGLPGTKKLSRNIAAAFGGGAHVVLMAHHGAVIVGKNREEAFEKALLLETICRLACKGQPMEPPAFEESMAERLVAAVGKAYGHAAYTHSAPVLSCAAGNLPVPAQLDDMAQLMGAFLFTVKPEENAVIHALRKKDAVLVPGVGALCHASTDSDCHAMCLLAEKSCICRLHTQASGVDARLSGFDTGLMRMVYLKKYAKKAGG